MGIDAGGALLNLQEQRSLQAEQQHELIIVQTSRQLNAQ
jgi:hypothetical protein